MSENPMIQVVIPTQVRTVIEEHCFSRLDVEVGGFLVGTVEGDDVTVTGSKPALTAESNQTHLTFTHEAWAEILEVLDTEFPGAQIVGWYHSHPGFSCFLSEYDIFIQENFFSGPGQHALVVDPLSGRWGIFVASGGKATEIASGDTDRAAVAHDGEDKVDAIIASSSSTPPRRRRWVAVAVAAVSTAAIVGSLAWFIGSVQGNDAAQRSADQKVQQARSEVAALQAQVAELSSQPSPVPTSPAIPSATSAPGASPVASPTAAPIGPVLLAPGDRGVFAMEYTVQPGDSLWSLAERYLGDGFRYKEILRANPKVRTDGLQPGTVVSIVVTGRLKDSVKGE